MANKIKTINLKLKPKNRYEKKPINPEIKNGLTFGAITSYISVKKPSGCLPDKLFISSFIFNPYNSKFSNKKDHLNESPF